MGFDVGPWGELWLEGDSVHASNLEPGDYVMEFETALARALEKSPKWKLRQLPKDWGRLAVVTHVTRVGFTTWVVHYGKLRRDETPAGQSTFGLLGSMRRIPDAAAIKFIDSSYFE